jgi:hypothetical protein
MSSNLHQFLVGAASSREKKSLYRHHRMIAAGSRSYDQHRLSQQLKKFLGSKEVSYSIRPAAFLAGGWADT